MTKTYIPRGRVLPPQFKEHASKRIEQTYHRAFTWGERLAILFGYHAAIKFTMHTEHSPGRIEAKCEVEITGDV